MLTLIEKVKYWGLKGVVNHFCGKFHKAALRQYFSDNLKKHPLTATPESGFTIIAPFRENYSLCKMAMDLVLALNKGRIPYQTFDLSNEKAPIEPQFLKFLTPKSDFKLTKYSHVVDFVSTPIEIELPLPIVHCHIVFWEFDTGLLEYYPATSDGSEILTFSNYNYELVRRLLPASQKVHKVLYPFHFDPVPTVSGQAMRKRLGFKESDFLVFNNFDYNSSFFRKNPIGTLQAFWVAFHETADAHLIFKTNHASQHPRQAESLAQKAEELGIKARVHFIDGFLSHDEIYALTAMADCQIFLHRGEGFGLAVAEAIHLQIPTVVTDYSATQEFCTEQTALLVPATITPLLPGEMDNPSYSGVTSYPEPDVKEAAEALRRLYEDPLLRDKLKKGGADFMQNYFSIENFVASVRALLDAAE